MNIMQKFFNSKLIFVLALFAGHFFLKSEEFKSFLIIVCSDHKNIENIFNQNYPNFRVVYIDSKSNESEFFAYQKCLNNLTIANLPQCLEKLGAVWSIIHDSHDDEIVIYLDNNKFFLDEYALVTLNDIYQKNDVWMSSGNLCDFNNACLFDPKECSNKKPWRTTNIALTEPLTFYSWLFKCIKLEDLTDKNNFLPNLATKIYYPMLEIAYNHLIFLKDPIISCDSSDLMEEELEYEPSEYEVLSTKPIDTKNDYADLVVFSYNRPMQLYAFLESVERYIKGINTISVICRYGNKSVSNAYEKVKKKFPNVSFLEQKDSLRGADFKQKTLSATFDTPSDYIIFAVDDIIVKDYVDVSECIKYLKKTKAYGFYLRLGENINHFYILDLPQKQPPFLPLDDQVYAWRFNSGGDWDWGCFASVDMTIHEKKLIKNYLENLKFDRPNYFEGAWSNSGSHLLNSFGLCYRTSKIVNLPLNKVQSDGSKNMGITANELLYRFNEGYKIDIDPLYKIDNQSAHMPYVPTYVKR